MLGLHMSYRMFTVEDLLPTLKAYHITTDGGAEESRYVVTTDLLGSGSFGRVHVGYQLLSTGDWIRVAIKTIDLSDERSAEEAVARVVEVGRESVLARRAAHPHVVRVSRPWFCPDQLALYIAMELCDESLFAYQRRTLGTAMPAAALCAIFVQLMDALAALARVGIVHNDVKPDNVLLQWPVGRDIGVPCVKLADFGLAVPRCEIARQKEPFLRGTAQFMAPEASDLTGACYPNARDVWSAACTVHLLLTGVPPFLGGTVAELKEAALHGRIVPCHELSSMGSDQSSLYHLVRSLLVPWASHRPTANGARVRVLQAIGEVPRPCSPPLPAALYRRFVACRPDTVIPVYRRPEALRAYETGYAFFCGDSNIIAEVVDAERLCPRIATAHRSRSAGQLKDGGAITSRAGSSPQLLSGPLRRAPSLPPPPPPPMSACEWLRVTHPYKGFCQLQGTGGPHLLHPHRFGNSSPVCAALSEASGLWLERSDSFTLYGGREYGAADRMSADATELAAADSPVARRPEEVNFPPAKKKSLPRLRAFFSRKPAKATG